MGNIIIGVDGYAGVGKSTICKCVSNKLNINYIDTGLIYRLITFLALKKELIVNNSLIDIDNFINYLYTLEFIIDNSHIYLNNNKVCIENLRSSSVSNIVGYISKLDRIRQFSVQLQRNICKKFNICILDGRDICTNVFPYADIKIFMTCDINVRVKRRLKEYINSKMYFSYEEIYKDIQFRDYLDSNREYNPIVKPLDAIHIDTTNVDMNYIIDFITFIIYKKKQEKGCKV